MIRTFGSIWGACLLLAACGQPQAGSSSIKDNPRPNIIYIYADDLGYGELGAYGQEKIRTPHLDQLAAEGIKFTDHYTSTPVCAPARCMLLTGKHGGNSFIRNNYELGGFADENEGGQMPLPENTITIGHLMQQAGYKTGAIGKWGLGFIDSSGEPNRQGFDYFYGYLDQKQAHNYYPTHLWENNQWDSLDNDYFKPHYRLEKAPNNLDEYEQFKGGEYAPDLMAEKALDFIQENQANPFFLYLPFTIPHVSLQVPENDYYKLYEGQFDSVPYLGQMGYTPHPQPLAAYAGMISTLDGYVGRIMKLLKALNLDENTLVMFSSDNGPTFNGGVNADFFNSTAGLRGLKMDIYEGGIRVPFIARWPRHIPEGQVTDFPSAQYDLMATLADLISIDPPTNDGISLLPTLLGKPEEQKPRDFLYFEFPGKGGQLAIRTGPWKGVKTNLFKDPEAPWQLYHLKEDPYETTDVASEHQGLLQKLDEIVKQEHQQATIREWEMFHIRESY